MRFRDIYLGVGSVLVLAVVFMSDPSVGLISQLPFGSSTIRTDHQHHHQSVLYRTTTLLPQALIDYIDMEVFFKRALETSQIAGMALIGVGLIMVSIATVIVAAAIK